MAMNPISQVALYDSARDTCNRLSGIYIDEERRATSEEERQRWLAKDLELLRERAQLNPDDEQGMIEARARWAEQIRQLEAADRIEA
jgi:hypothetical protein